MHSSVIRGTDFRIQWNGELISHREFFTSFGETDRVGVVILQRFEGLGAITLIMAYVTAFYDRYRQRGSEFYAYPDFFTFQRVQPCANYCMCDIWPPRKNVHVSEDAQQTVEAIADRGVNVLLVPDENARESSIEPVDLESMKRNVRRCFSYSETGKMDSCDLVVECQSALLKDFGLAVLESVPADDSLRPQRDAWLKRMTTEMLSQSFRELELTEALQRI